MDERWLRPRVVLLAIAVLASPLLARAQSNVVGAPLAFVGTGGTDSKPQSKCFYAQGAWWCVLLDGADTFLWKYDGFRTWTKQTVPGVINVANGGRADCLSAGNTLYVVITSGNAKIYKYVFDGTNYVKAPGWTTPITLASGTSTAVIAQDSSGRLWLAADAASRTQIVAYHTTTDDRTWAGPIVLDPGVAADIATIVAFGGDRVGVFWSSRPGASFLFRVHLDSDPPATWQPVEVVDGGPMIADNHVHVEAAADGRVYAAAKTAFSTAGQPNIVLYVRSAAGAWGPRVTVRNYATPAATRPIVRLDPPTNRAFVFYTLLTGGSTGGVVDYATSDMDTLSFGAGQTFIAYDTSRFNDVSSAKDPATGASGIVAVAKDLLTQTAYFNTTIDADADTYTVPLDCDDADGTVNPGATEIPYNGKDDDCNPATRDDDVDGDGYLVATDCDDDDPAVNPGATEVPYNGKDDDCDPLTKDDDLDGDGYPIATDCNDGDPTVNPGQTEVPGNGKDDDCNPATLDSPVPNVSVGDAPAVTEGDSGFVNAVFTVTLSTATSLLPTVDYATAPGSASAGVDYVTTSGRLTFLPGETTQTVAVRVLGDGIDEGNEGFTLDLTGAVDAVIVDDQGTGTILDDDPLPSLAVANVTVPEGNAGTTNADFVVTLSAVSSFSVTVDYATAPASARPALDYQSVSGTLTFAPGDTTATVSVPVVGDTRRERNEAFLVNLFNPNSAKLGDAEAQGTILTDDGLADTCLPIASVPFTIAAPGRYCLARSITTDLFFGAAIDVASDDVTLDLQGRTLQGTAGVATQAYGIFASQHKNIVVRNGTLRGFFAGIFLGQSGPYTLPQGHRLTSLNVIESTSTGIEVEGRGNVVSLCTVKTTGGTTTLGSNPDAFGIVAQGPANRVHRNLVWGVAGSGSGTGYGIVLRSGDGAQATRNRVANPTVGTGTGIRALASTGAAVDYNQLSHFTLGILFDGGTTGSHAGNTFLAVTTTYVGP